MLVLPDEEWLLILGKKCSYAHRQVDEQPTKRCKKNDDKSAVAMRRMIDTKMYGNLLLTVTKSPERSGRPDMNRDTHHELKRGPTGRRSSNARHLGCIFQDMKPPKSFPRKSSDMQKPIQRVHVTLKFETKVRRLDIFA